MLTARKKRNANRREDECSGCGGSIEVNRILSGQTYCAECQLKYQRKNRPKFINLSDFQKKKHQARTKANLYLRRGNIKKEPCSVCGNPKSEMHHDDYDKALDIKWFCRVHHIEYHKNNPNVL
jgi:hypothetical protein